MIPQYAILIAGNVVKDVSFEDWATWFENADRIIRRTKIGNVEVSTVFLGVNQAFGNSPSLWFETMIFSDDEYDQECWRYSTINQAIEGHNKILQEFYNFKE